MADDLIVPGEFVTNEDLGLDIPDAPAPLGEFVRNEDLGLAPPEPAQLQNRLGPRGAGGADYGISRRGSQRQNTIGGAAGEAADIAVLRSQAGVLFDDERTRLERAMQSDSPVEVDAARRALARKERDGTLGRSPKAQAEDAIIEQLAYEHSGSFESLDGTLGSLVGAVVAPESVGGLASILVRKFPMLAGRPVATTALDAAIVNTLTDPVIQGVRVGSGGQEKYDVLQTALAPVAGAVVGGALGGAGAAASRALASRELNSLPRLTPEEIAADMRIATDSFSSDNAQMRRSDSAPFGQTKNADIDGVMAEDFAASRSAQPQAQEPDPIATAAADLEEATGIRADLSEPIIRDLAEEPPAAAETGIPVAEPHVPAEPAPKLEPTAPPLDERIAAARARPVGGPGIVAADRKHTDLVKKVWREDTPYAVAEDMLVAAPANQKRFGDVARQIEAETGIKFEDPGVKALHPDEIAKITDPAQQALKTKGLARFQEKAGKAARPGGVTDLVRGGFVVKTPEDADAALAKLAERFEVIDDGWFVTNEGYFDRKAFIRFEDGMIGQVQFWEPSLLHAKERDGGGHELYEEWRSLPMDSDRAIELGRQMAELYFDAAKDLAPAWITALGAGGKSGNSASQTSSGSLRPSLQTSLSSTQAPSLNTQQPANVASVGSPSSVPTQTPGGSSNVVDIGSSGTNLGDKPTDVKAGTQYAPAGEGVDGNAVDLPSQPVPADQQGLAGPALEPASEQAVKAAYVDARQAIEAPESLAEFSPEAAIPPSVPDSPAGVFTFDVTTLQTDPRRFQFKEGGDEYGVTHALKGVTKWDAAKANQVIVWQAQDGGLYVVDGHQRSGLARRLVAQGYEERITIPGLLYREEDGFTAANVRSIAAAKNIAEGSGSPIDGAKILRENPGLIDGSMPLSRSESRQAFDLAKLSDEAFRMVINQVVPENYAAQVGRLIPKDGPRQEAAMKALARFEPSNVEQASILIQRVNEAELAKATEGSQGSMFGDVMGAESTAGEEMKIVDRAIKNLKRDKGLFERVLANADRIEQTGSTVERSSAQSVATDAQTFAKVLTSEAYSKGPIRDALIAAARGVKDGSITIEEASKQIIGALRREAPDALGARTGDSPRTGAGPAGEGPLSAEAGRSQPGPALPDQQVPDAQGLKAEPGAEGLPQTLVPGIEPVTDRQRLELAASKPMQGGDAPPAAGGLFDENGQLQDSLFRRGAGQPNQVLPNQMELGRPKVDQGTAAPAATKLAGLEDISRKLVEAFPVNARVGRVIGGAEGMFKTRSGVIRVRSVSDFDTLAHEVGHALHLGGGAKSDFDAIVRANTPELTQFGAGQDALGNAEAFANLFHAYVTSRPFAQINYPNATAALDTLLQTKFPDVHKGIEEVRQALDLLHRAPSVDVIRAGTITAAPPRFGETFRELVASERDPQGRVVYSAMDALYTGTVDSNHPVYRAMTNLVEIAAANGKTIDLKPLDDAYILARRLPGSHGSADTMLKYGVIAVGDPRPQGPSLSSGIEKALGKKWDAAAFEDFGAYLAARRMVAEYERFFKGELERPPGKLSLADYVRAVQEFETAHPTFADGARDIYAFQHNHLKRQFDKGMVTREYFDLASQRQDYVPAMRDMRDFPEGPGVPSKTGADGKGLLSRSIMKKFRGSDRPIINPLESIFKRVHDLEFAIARNDSINALARMAQDAGPGSGWIYEDIPSNQLKPQRVDIIEALRSAGKTAGLDALETKALILQAEDALGDSTWATLFRQEPIQEGAEPIVYRWVNGERRAGRLGDARLGQELHHALTSMSDYEKDIFTTVLSLTSTILRTAITKAPDFIITNMIRDQFSSSLTAGRKYIPFVSMGKGLVEALRKSPDSIEFAGQGGLAGGGIVEAMSSSQFGRNVKSLQSANWFGQVLKAFELSETGTRVGLYKSYLEQARAMGFDAENAALYAVHKADDYIDFRKHGASMGVMRRIFTFLNAFIQGTDREIRAVSDLPALELKRSGGVALTAQEVDRLKDARVALVRLTTMGIVLGSGLAILNQDNENVQNAPKHFKNTNFLFSLNGTDFAVPKGFGVVLSIINLFERSTEFAMRRDPSLATDWLESVVTAFMAPSGNPGLTLQYDLPANYDRFRGRPIIPYYMQGWDPTEQYTAYTSSVARQVAKAADMAGMKISPMKVDYTLQALGGGMARDVLLSWDAVMGNDRPEKQIYDYPVARRFVKNLERGSRATEVFYGLVGEKTGEYELAESAYRGKVTNGERAAAAEYLRNLKDDQKAWVTLNTLGFDVSEKRMHPMYNAREQLAVINGMVRQLVNGNVVKEDDVDRRDTVRSRRDATPLALDPRQRAKLSEELLSLSVATTRNAMVAVGAKGTGGLGLMDTGAIRDRIQLLSPEAATEFQARLASKRLPTFENAAAAWPEMKRRLLVDGESADLADMVPVEARKKRR